MNKRGLRNVRPAIIAVIFCIVTVSGLLAQTFTTMLDFTGNNGSGPAKSLVPASDGNF